MGDFIKLPKNNELNDVGIGIANLANSEIFEKACEAIDVDTCITGNFLLGDKGYTYCLYSSKIAIMTPYKDHCLEDKKK